MALIRPICQARLGQEGGTWLGQGGRYKLGRGGRSQLDPFLGQFWHAFFIFLFSLLSSLFLSSLVLLPFFIQAQLGDVFFFFSSLFLLLGSVRPSIFFLSLRFGLDQAEGLGFNWALATFSSSSFLYIYIYIKKFLGISQTSILQSHLHLLNP